MTSVILQYHRVRAVRVCWECMDGPETACRLRTQSLSFPIFFAIILMITFLYFHFCHNLYFWPYFWLSRCFSVLQLSACTPHLFFPVIICLHEDSLSVSLAGEWLITLLWLPIGLIKGEAVWYPYRLLLVLIKDHRTAVCHALLVVENLFFFVVFPMIFFPHS